MKLSSPVIKRIWLVIAESPLGLATMAVVGTLVLIGAANWREQREQASLSLDQPFDSDRLEGLPQCERDILELKLRARAKASDFRPLTGYDVDRAMLSCQDKQRAAEQAAALVRATKQ